MPISVTCPECEATYRVADEAAGKAIKCKKCGARVPVPAAGGDDEDEEKVPAKAGKAKDGDEAADEGEGGEAKAKKKAGKGKLFAILGGAAAFVCCCCMVPGGGVGSWYMGWIPGIGGGGGGGGTVVLEKKETLTTNDPKGKDGKSAKKNKIKLETGKKYVIDMKANKTNNIVYDPFLRLLDPTGKEVMSN